MGIGLLPLGLLAALMMTIDEDAGPYDGLYGLAIAGIGAFALIAALVGGALGRWALGLVGLVLLVQATEIGVDLVRYPGAPSRVTLTVLAVLVVLGVVAVATSLVEIVAHRRSGRL